MTTIAAVSIDGVHAIAADGLLTSGDLIASLKYIKVFDYGVVIAVAGNARISDLISFAGPNAFKSPFEFVAFLELTYQSHYYERESSSTGPPNYLQEYFYLTNHGIVEIGQDLAVLPVGEGIPAAIGSGADFAIGAMESMIMVRDFSARDLVLYAVQVAIKRENNTGGSIMLALRGTESFGPEWIDPLLL